MYEQIYGFPQPIERLGFNPAWTTAPTFGPVSDADARADAMIAALVAKMRRLAPCHDQCNATILMTLLRLAEGQEAALMETYSSERLQ
jgi:hypothetical protein